MLSSQKQTTGINNSQTEIQNYLISKQPKAIIINSNVLIRDSLFINIEAINYVLKKHGLPILNEKARQNGEKQKSMKFNFSKIFGEILDKEAYDEYNRYLVSISDRISLSEGFIELLQFCKKNCIKTVIASNQGQTFINSIFDKFELKPYFDLIITPYELNLSKPDSKILISAVEELNLKLREDTLIFIGSSIDDICLSFQYNFIPVLLDNDSNEVSESQLKVVQNMNFDNPLRVIKKLADLIEMLSKIQKNEEEEIMKITYIGAAGKIGREAIPLICEIIPNNVKIEFVLIGSGSEASLSRLQGFLEDIKGSLNCNNDSSKDIEFVISNDYSKISKSKVVLCSAGKWPNDELRKKFEKVDPSGRTKQSFANKEMMEEISKNVEKYAPNCLFVITTNQVDMMCEIARLKAPKLNVIGLSGLVDSSRLKQIIKQDLGLDSSGFMIGFHNSTMMPLIKSVKVNEKLLFPFLSEELNLDDDELNIEMKNLEIKKLESILTKTRNLGSFIAKMQKVGLDSNKDTGSSILPAKSLVKIVDAFCFDQKLTESFNTLIKDQKVADHYGVPLNTALSIPLKIEKDKITQVTDIPVLQFEKVKLREAQLQMDEQVKILINGDLSFLDKE